MCGILGIINDSTPVSRRDFACHLDTLANRGPDGTGAVFRRGDTVAIGHTRLAIIDLSEAGHQPMCNEDDSVVLSCNGEIYNYVELRRQLTAMGHAFRSHSDSEVVLHGYEQWGDAVVHRLNGMFAFALWDANRERLLVARDPVGIKPLYYAHTADGLCFASEARTILQIDDTKRACDEFALAQYLAHRYVPSPRSGFKGIAKLAPGHTLVYSNSKTSIERFWRLGYSPSVSNEAEAVELMAEKISAAVTRQLVSDVNVGVFLSGGIDSSGVAAFAASRASEAPPAFTLGFVEHTHDERPYAERMSQHLSVPHHVEVMSADRFIGALGRFADIYDEPFFDYSGIFVNVLARRARDVNVPVILSGDGGDEVFAGYRWYDDPYGQREGSRLARLKRKFKIAASRQPLDVYFGRVGIMGDADRDATLSRANVYRHMDLLDDLYSPDAPIVSALQMVDFHTFLPDDILAKVDRASMACGVEVRVPLLDVEVVTAAFSIESSVIMRQGERKSLLKKVFSGRVPPEILSARKKGFGAPLVTWMSQGLAGIAAGLLPDGVLVNSCGLSRRGVLHTLRDANAEHVWLLLAAELWARRWLEGHSSDMIDHDIAAIRGKGASAMTRLQLCQQES